MIHRQAFLAAIFVLSSVGAMHAEDSVSLESLSQFEQGQAKALIDRLSSATEAEYADRLTEFGQDFARVGLNPKPVLAVVRAAAGDKTDFFDRVMQAKCAAENGSGNFCMIAKADQGAPNTSDVSTAATGAGGSVGGALSGTGSSGSGASNTGSSGGGDSSNSNSPQSFSRRGGSAGSVSDTVVAGGTTVVQVPGPEAGAGFGAVALMLGFAAWRRRNTIALRIGDR